ncbi:MAG TPA: DNA polymerase III subunit delta' [Anaerolineales bacterium]|nr:DNA polymerase III subunit delta' [Anaerolineales bacterium]
MNKNWDLLGNEWAVEMLQRQIVRGTLRHAYLFTGPSGVGRRTLALRLAQALNCTQAADSGIPCGQCRDCKQIEVMQHPDLSIIQADHEGGILKVEQVREARRMLMLKPYQSKYRVTVLLRFQEANDHAANALLKILEEAPSYVILVLTADYPEQLLPTVLSRCEVLRLRPLPMETVESNLVLQGANQEQARWIAHISGGRLGYALRLLRDPSALEFRNEKLNELQSFGAAARSDKFSYAEKLAKDRDAMRNVLLLWLSYWRDVLLCAGGSSTPLANVDRTSEITSLAAHVSLPEARRVVSELETSLSQLESNVNARLLAEVLLLDWPKL